MPKRSRAAEKLVVEIARRAVVPELDVWTRQDGSGWEVQVWRNTRCLVSLWSRGSERGVLRSLLDDKTLMKRIEP